MLTQGIDQLHWLQSKLYNFWFNFIQTIANPKMKMKLSLSLAINNAIDIIYPILRSSAMVKYSSILSFSQNDFR